MGSLKSCTARDEEKKKDGEAGERARVLFLYTPTIVISFGIVSDIKAAKTRKTTLGKFCRASRVKVERRSLRAERATTRGSGRKKINVLFE